MSDQWIVVLIFIAVFVGIITEKIDKTLIVLSAALVLMLAGFLDFEEAIHAVDFDTIGLLMGMMLFVEGFREIGLFKLFSVKLGLYTKGNPILIFFVGGAATAIFSAFLDNVTTVLIVVPLMISLTQGMGLPPKVYILSVIFLSNIGGAATLIGDPPNILIGSQVPELTFASFIQYLTAPVVASALAAFAYIKLTNKSAIASRKKNFAWLFMSNLMLEDIKRQDAELKIPPQVLRRSLIIFALVLLGFFTHSITHFEPAVVAIAGAVLLLVTFSKRIDLHHLVARVEWPTLLFFAGLFIVVGGLEKVGVLEVISHELVSLTDNLWVLLMLILFASAILSAVVDNIPFVAVMIPVLKDLLADPTFAGHPKAGLLWWALALGACFGGNGSMIGASANVVSCAIADKAGIKIGFKEFLKYSVPVTFLSIVVSALYLSALYFM